MTETTAAAGGHAELRGPDGLDGLEGPEGPEGPDRADRPDGVDGLDGLDGRAGAAGRAGADGLAGAEGLAGAAGVAGVAGAAGTAGAAGAGGRDDGPVGAVAADSAERTEQTWFGGPAQGRPTLRRTAVIMNEATTEIPVHLLFRDDPPAPGGGTGAARTVGRPAGYSGGRPGPKRQLPRTDSRIQRAVRPV
ncbi:hypothetical protein G3I19_26685, partial [Streptomyces sp. SID10853]|nr:hypothetical protein [Streptomyces sp. SID10853]